TELHRYPKNHRKRPRPAQYSIHHQPPIQFKIRKLSQHRQTPAIKGLLYNCEKRVVEGVFYWGRWGGKTAIFAGRSRNCWRSFVLTTPWYLIGFTFFSSLLPLIFLSSGLFLLLPLLD